jgi:ribosome-binding factor A
MQAMSKASYPRVERVREAIKEILALEVERLRDPGLGFVTITEVTMSRDLRNARVYYTVYGADAVRAATADAMKRAAGHLRTAVAKQVRLRYVPQIEFIEDPVPERTRRLDEIITEIHKPHEEAGE